MGYFIPGIRHVIAIVAGSSGLEFRTFSLFAFSGALVWTGLFICAGYYLGDGWQVFPETMTTVAIWVLAGIAAAGIAFWIYRISRKPRRGDRG